MQALLMVFIGQVVVAFLVVVVLRAMLEKELIESAVRSLESRKRDRASPFYIPDPAEDVPLEKAEVKIVSYKKLHARYQKRIQRAVEDSFGRGVIPAYIVDKSILGGVVFHIGDKVVEYSLRDRLKRMKDGC
jgi:hypothetical protein